MKRYMIILIIIAMTGLFWIEARGQKASTAAVPTSATQQPLYTDYRGVKLGMAPGEVRAILGNPVLKDAELDYFVISDTVSAQVAYDTAHKVKAISVDYAGGAGAPDYRSVIGTALKTREDGSAFGMIRYDASGFWVSYSRTAPPVSIVSITISKFL